VTERLRILPDGRRLAASRADVAAALDHGDASACPPGAGGLRAAMARFSHGADHRRRRAVGEERLAAVDPAALRARARDLAAAVLAAADRIDHVAVAARPTPPALMAQAPARIDLMAAAAHRIDLMAAVARPVPLAALAEALGASDGPAAAGAARRLALALAPPLGAAAGDPEPPAAELARLLGLPADPLDEVVANTVALCFQAVDATAGLIGLAVLSGCDDPDAAVAAALAAGGPALRTYRWATRDLDLPTGTVPAGAEIVVALPAGDAPFGAGPHRCPGADLAVALACGVVEAVLASGLRLPAGPPAFEPRDNLRIPAALLLSR
jgi:hypothetical protein